jgi:hypothetical protein
MLCSLAPVQVLQIRETMPQQQDHRMLIQRPPKLSNV